MRALATAAKIERLMQALGAAVRGPGRIYLAGGATAVLMGWRESTLDVDLKLDPEPPGALDAIARLKDELDVNVELASPDGFIPVPPGWQDRSRFIASHGSVAFFHYDLAAQALAKIERGHAQDEQDVREMLARGLVSAAELWRLYGAVEPALSRFPAIDPDDFRDRMQQALGPAPAGGGRDG